MKTTITNPTIRKVLNRGWRPIRYHVENKTQTYSEHRHGWIVEDLPNGGARVQLIGEEGVRRLNAEEMRYVTPVT